MFLQMNNITKVYGEGESRTEALRGIDLAIEKDELCVLLGPSGSGKSTLLNTIGGIDGATAGSLRIGDHVLREMNEKALTRYRRDHIGYVFQQYNLIPNLTVRENIETGAYLSSCPLSVDDLLATLGIEDQQDKLPQQLSGGQQQRCSIGRAVVKNPDVLLCDEPTGALDYANSKEILRLIEEVNQKYGSTGVMVTHNEAIRGMADHIVEIKDGLVRRDERNEKKMPAEALSW